MRFGDDAEMAKNKQLRKFENFRSCLSCQIWALINAHEVVRYAIISGIR